MRSVGVFEAKNRLSELVEQASQGQEIMITRRGQAVAKLGPPGAATTELSAMEAISGVRSLRRGIRLKGVSIKSLVKKGRR